MTVKNRSQQGFTVLELIVVIVFLVAAGTIIYVQKRDLETAQRDSAAKTAINAMFFNLEDIYYPANQSYPEKLTPEALRGLDPAILKDSNSKQIGDKESDYYYEPKDCKDGKCKSYSLRADLVNENDFVKESRNK